MIGELAAKRITGKGPDGYREALWFLGGAAMSRIERLAALLDQPLLVTSGVNVRYLTSLASSNAAVLVEPDGDATLFTDFRYAQRASALDIRFEQTARAVIGDLATRLAGRTIGDRGARADGRVARGAQGRRRRDRACRPGLVERLRAVKEPDEIETLRAGGRDLGRRLRRARRGALRRPHRARALLARARALPRARLLGALVRHRRCLGGERREPARRGARRRDPGEHARHDRRRLPRRRLRVGLHAHVRDRRAARTSSRAPTRSASRRSSPGLEAIGPGVSGRDADAGAARRHRRRRLGRAVRPRARARDRPRGARGARAPAGVDRRARGRATSSAASPASTCRASAACGSRTWCSSPTTAASA